MPGVGDEVQLGMTAMLILSEPASERVARLPLSALFDQGAGPCVYTADAATGAITLKPVSVKAYESNDCLDQRRRRRGRQGRHARRAEAQSRREGEGRLVVVVLIFGGA